MDIFDFLFGWLFDMSWWSSNNDNREHRGCGWAIFFGVLLLLLIGVVLWLVLRPR